MIAILLVGGFGTRLRPLTVNRAKGLIPVLNRPFLSYQLDLLKQGGVTDAVLAAGRHARHWEKGLRNLTPKGLRLHFVYEPKPMGTGGAIRYAYDSARRRMNIQEPVLVFNGDVFFDLDIRKFAAFHRSRAAEATIALTEVEDVSRFGVVKTDARGQVQRFIEKPKRPVGSNYVNAGAYLLNPKWIERIPAGEPVSIERDSFPASLARREKVFGFPMGGYWNDIGTLATYLQAHRDLLFTRNRWTGGTYLRKNGLRFEGRVRVSGKLSVGGRAVIGAGTRIGKNVALGGFVSLGKNVTIKDGAFLTDTVVLDGATIGANVRTDGAIIGRDCRVGDNADLGPGTALGDRTTLSDFTRC